MIRKLISFFSLMAISFLLWFTNSRYPHILFQKALQTFLVLVIIYFIFSIVLEEIIIKKIKESKTRYSFKRTISILELVVLAIIIITIWVENVEALVVSYGLIGAGVAIALQDFFKNFVGGIVVFLTGIYRVGDRIEMDSNYGDVMDIGILYTTLMETREWVSGEQATGRLKIIPNGQVLSKIINNYTKDHDFIWDEMSIPITYDSDSNEAINRILSIVKNETKEITIQAEKEIAKIGEKYYLPKRDVEPAIYLTLTDNWIAFNIRYVTKVRERRFLRNKLSRMILDEIQKSKKIKIASSTLDIIGLPELKIKQKKNI